MANEENLEACAARLRQLYHEMRTAREQRVLVNGEDDPLEAKRLDDVVGKLRQSIIDEDDNLKMLRGPVGESEDWDEESTVSRIMRAWAEDTAVGSMLFEPDSE